VDPRPRQSREAKERRPGGAELLAPGRRDRANRLLAELPGPSAHRIHAGCAVGQKQRGSIGGSPGALHRRGPTFRVAWRPQLDRIYDDSLPSHEGSCGLRGEGAVGP